MIHVIATIEVAPGKRPEFLEQFAWLAPQVRAEAGCIEYGGAVDVPTTIPVQVPPRPDVVTVVEKWESLAALQEHLAAPHMAEYRQRVSELVSRVTLQVLDPV